VRKQEALTLLVNHQSTLKNFGVKSLMIFGSVARDEAQANSDVDLRWGLMRGTKGVNFADK
jgi:predicted nucleotidyltransferase